MFLAPSLHLIGWCTFVRQGIFILRSCFQRDTENENVSKVQFFFPLEVLPSFLAGTGFSLSGRLTFEPLPSWIPVLAKYHLTSHLISLVATDTFNFLQDLTED